MTVGELRAFLATLPEGAQVAIYADRPDTEVRAEQAIMEELFGRVVICGFATNTKHPPFLVWPRSGAEQVWTPPAEPRGAPPVPFVVDHGGRGPTE